MSTGKWGSVPPVVRSTTYEVFLNGPKDREEKDNGIILKYSHTSLGSYQTYQGALDVASAHTLRPQDYIYVYRVITEGKKKSIDEMMYYRSGAPASWLGESKKK